MTQLRRVHCWLAGLSFHGWFHGWGIFKGETRPIVEKEDGTIILADWKFITFVIPGEQPSTQARQEQE